MLAIAVTTAAAYMAPHAAAPAIQRRAPQGAVAMAGNKKIYGVDAVEYDTGLFEVREVEISKPPVSLLKRIGELKVATTVSELGLLSTLEENGVFSKLENAGAFSLAEKALPTIESLGLLSLFEELLDVECGTIFTAANFLIVFAPAIFTLQICGFLPFPEGPVVPLELLTFAGTLAGGVALWITAYIIGVLQGD